MHSTENVVRRRRRERGTIKSLDTTGRIRGGFNADVTTTTGIVGHINYSGLVIAGVGFFLTRFTVTLAIYEDPVRFLLSGVVPLTLGLGLAAFGVALAVADIESALARTTALWCVVGTGGMLLLVVLTLLGSAGGMSTVEVARTQATLSTFLIGGSVGGTLTGLYAARSRRQRTALRQQTNRLVVLNRMLRHEVLNALTPIRGFGAVDTSEHPEANRVIESRTDDIEATVEEVGYLAKQAGEGAAGTAPTRLSETLTAALDSVRERYPDTTIETASVDERVHVAANERLPQAIAQLLENAIVHANDECPRLDVTATRTAVDISVTDDGDGLPESQQRLLEDGEIGDFDDPRAGYGLNVVRLLVESYGGAVETDTDANGTTVTVVLARTDTADRSVTASESNLAGIRPDVSSLFVTLAASILAGVAYGITSEELGGSIAGIGVFYGTVDPLVGWLTHEFHSIVFGFVFVSLRSLAPARYRSTLWPSIGLGVAWGLVLWIGASGIVAPLWLRLLGTEVPVPNLVGLHLLTHLVWGVTLGALTAWGDRVIAPRVSRIGDRIEARTDQRSSSTN